MKQKILLVLIAISFLACGGGESTTKEETSPPTTNLIVQKVTSNSLTIKSIELEIYSAIDLNDSTYENKSIHQLATFEESSLNWSVQIDGLETGAFYIFVAKAYSSESSEEENLVFLGSTTAQINEESNLIEINLKQIEESNVTSNLPFISGFNAITEMNESIVLNFTLHNPNEETLNWEIRHSENNQTTADFSLNSGVINTLNKTFSLDYLAETSNEYIIILWTEESGVNYTFKIDKETNEVTPPSTNSGKIKQTLQTKSYDQTGVETTSSKDDGYYQRGVTPSYERNSSTNIITDNITGLMWQDANTTVLTWVEANQTCQTLKLGNFGDWRLPTPRELDNLVTYYPKDSISTTHPVLLDPLFEERGTSNPKTKYWSSYAFEGVGIQELAWYVDFTMGNHGDGRGNQSSTYHVKCVRGTSKTPIFTRDNTKNIVIDTLNKLEWQDDGVFIAESWSEALERCENLTLSQGETDANWRLPNINELKSIVNRERNPRIDEAFITNPDFGNSFWSSTAYFNSTNFAYVFEVTSGSGQTVMHIDKSLTNSGIYSRCVRDVK